MNIVTGYRGEPHITSNATQAFNQGVVGSANYVLNVGQKFDADLTDVNTVTIADGEGVLQGAHFRIDPGESETVNIANGTVDMNRIDLICARYTKNATTGIEDVSLVVIQGEESASTPTEPTYNTGDILDGDTPIDFPLYQVELEGLTPTLTPLFSSIMSMEIMNTNQLETTYSNNTYVTEENFAYLQFYQMGKVVYAIINLQISNSPGTTWRTIGSVSIHGTPLNEVVLTMANQGNAYNLLFQIQTDGTIRIYSNGSSTGWYRGVGFMILP